MRAATTTSHNVMKTWLQTILFTLSVALVGTVTQGVAQAAGLSPLEQRERALERHEQAKERHRELRDRNRQPRTTPATRSKPIAPTTSFSGRRDRNVGVRGSRGNALGVSRSRR